MVKLIVGLGNPGPQYQLTRHNAGFWWVDELATRHGGQFRSDSRYNGELCQITIDGQPLWLLKPMTFMNRSGQPIARLAGFYKLPIDSILVAHDELDLPVGAVRLKKAGGHGGHNGLRDTIQHLGGNGFLRLRIGIGHPGSSRDVTGYVLGRAPQSEQRLIEDALDESCRALPDLLAGRMDKAMQRLHSRRIDTPDPT